MDRLTIPPYLEQGDRVIIISPSSQVKGEYIEGAKRMMESWGLEVIVSQHAYNSYGKFAGTASERIEDMQRAMDDERAKVIFCSRGGYGAVHLLDKLNFKRFRKHPKWLIGYSDITALHCLFQQKGFMSLHSHMAKHLTLEPADEPCTATLKQILFGEAARRQEGLSYTAPVHKLNHYGVAEGTLRGGNLAVFYGLRGTPYDIPPAGSILFVEDISERAHAIERMFYNLKLGGVLKRLSGLIVGRFTDYEETYALGRDLYSALADLLQEYDYPICFNYPVGHIPESKPLIEGCRVTLDVSKQETKLQFHL